MGASRPQDRLIVAKIQPIRDAQLLRIGGVDMRAVDEFDATAGAGVSQRQPDGHAARVETLHIRVLAMRFARRLRHPLCPPQDQLVADQARDPVGDAASDGDLTGRRYVNLEALVPDEPAAQPFQ